MTRDHQAPVETSKHEKEPIEIMNFGLNSPGSHQQRIWVMEPQADLKK